MLVKNTLPSQSYSSDTKHEHSSSNVEKLFHSLINDDEEFNISFDEEELKNLSFEEAKELKIKLEDNGYLQNLDSEIEGLSPSGSGLLKVVTFTYDEEFNKSLFETMKQKDNPKQFLDEMIHNIEYTKGNREYLWPNVSEDEILGEYVSLDTRAIKMIDVQEFLGSTIAAYEKLLSTKSENYETDEIEQSLKDLKTIQNGYKTIDNEKSALLSSMMRVSRPNPLLGQF